VVVVTLSVMASTRTVNFLEALVLWQLGLFSGVFAPVAVTPRLLRRTEAAV
jgi:hypothetical protein